MTRLAGGCLCGAVRFSVEDAFRYALICHCSQCRRSTGSAFKPFAGIERTKFEVEAGADGSSSSATRTATMRIAELRQLPVLSRPGWADRAREPRRAAGPAVYPADCTHLRGLKAPWHEISDDLPQHDKLP